MTELVLAPADFVAVLNQTLEYAYPGVVIEGELANFRVSKNRWVYFDLKDEVASVSFFGTVYNLPGPLEDGLLVRVQGNPRLHPRFGFSVNFNSIVPAGQGSIKQAADLLFKKLEAEGLFKAERKRPLPPRPTVIGLVTAGDSAAAADFIKIINERWAGLTIKLVNSLVQGDQAPPQLVRAIDYLNQLPGLPDLLVMIRGGGSAEDLAAFSDERVVRAVAASRVPTLIAIGHEVDISLAELAADARASTPTNAAQMAVPDKHHELATFGREAAWLERSLQQLHAAQQARLKDSVDQLHSCLSRALDGERRRLEALAGLIKLLDPAEALKRGYAIVRRAGKLVKSTSQVKPGDHLELNLSDGKIQTIVEAK